MTRSVVFVLVFYSEHLVHTHTHTYISFRPSDLTSNVRLVRREPSAALTRAIVYRDGVYLSLFSVSRKVPLSRN